MPMDKLVKQIARQYRRKGYSAARAKRIARATVYGKIERGRKHGRKSHR